ncbi:tetratricopeptide repeat protein [Neorhizobium sp. NPDC001467]|uniref:tetratricopeptide repeat protein n=1 Tax=Neorhizobium sp. NPDC001467 TaxID=3390595 RepID=UPI003D02AF0D
MAHNDDSFIREVNDELRSEQMNKAWKRFGRIFIGAAAVLVIAVAGYRAYEYWHSNNASASGDRFVTALDLAGDQKNDEAIAALSEIEKDASGSYPVLAKLRVAALQAEKGDKPAAIAGFQMIAKDNGVPALVRDVARLRAAFLMVDTAGYEQVAAEAEVLSGDGQALRHSAREVLGLAAYKADNMKQAKDWFTQITNAADAPRPVAARAQIMLDNIAASGKAP